jgi:hypothetical protein
MVEEKVAIKEGFQVPRLYEQPSDAVSFYADLAQIIYTGNEIVMQFYETIPGPPDSGGAIKSVRSRLRATVTVSISHGLNIGKLLVEKVERAKK